MKYGRWVPGDMQIALEAARNNDVGSTWLPLNTTPKAAQKRYLDGGVSYGWIGSLHQFLIESSPK
jgi:hypothetical protein